jgi:hypothetical protein
VRCRYRDGLLGWMEVPEGMRGKVMVALQGAPAEWVVLEVLPFFREQGSEVVVRADGLGLETLKRIKGFEEAKGCDS